MIAPFTFCSVAFILLFLLVLTLRVGLADQQAALNDVYLADEDCQSMAAERPMLTRRYR
jgi:hypothetical protein